MSNLRVEEHHLPNMTSTSAIGEPSSAQNHMLQTMLQNSLEHHTMRDTTLCYFLTQHGIAEDVTYMRSTRKAERRRKRAVNQNTNIDVILYYDDLLIGDKPRSLEPRKKTK